MDILVKIAAAEIGVKEIQGDQHNPRILEYQEMTGLEFGNDDIAWCSIFVNWCALQAGLPTSNSAMAQSWKNIGRKTSYPKPGDIAIFWRNGINSGQGHVGLYMGYKHDQTKIFVLGGNQDDEVNIKEYSVNRLIGFRRLKSGGSLELPVGYLRKGDSNLEVKKLQIILIDLEYLTGSADGVFGDQTEIALMNLQEDNDITVDGIYGSESRGILESIFGQ